jgi:hypothetical protein
MRTSIVSSPISGAPRAFVELEDVAVGEGDLHRLQARCFPGLNGVRRHRTCARRSARGTRRTPTTRRSASRVGASAAIEAGDKESLLRFRAEMMELAKPLNVFIERNGLIECLNASTGAALDE